MSAKHSLQRSTKVDCLFRGLFSRATTTLRATGDFEFGEHMIALQPTNLDLRTNWYWLRESAGQRRRLCRHVGKWNNMVCWQRLGVSWCKGQDDERKAERKGYPGQWTTRKAPIRISVERVDVTDIWYTRRELANSSWNRGRIHF